MKKEGSFYGIDVNLFSSQESYIYDVRKKGCWVDLKELLQIANVCRCQKGEWGGSDHQHAIIHNIFFL